ncbi:hypothetical protein F1188_01935 [Roseospira marina]|uniref:Uncharacterized protein n=1 Tax=Roseospira marina TaxID=140057 RepID=A0A5M6IHW2_9PROT|nr:hypothetical protein [Roseospira marina]KAA5607547.1 hypothetical protein F1188_01935 [Roseospira marina]MBB4312266.1 hypothetical protein [Roseospira marina]MBB5085718.1 hypothetical protein [Roseospira marina]
MTRVRRLAAATLVLATAGLGLTAPAAAQSSSASQAPIRSIGADDNPPMVAFECTTPAGPPVRMEMVLRRMAGQVWAYSSLERGVDCSSLSTGGITCMSDVLRGRGTTLQNTLNDLLKDENVRCTRSL